MATRPFHLAWFLSQGYGPKSWRSVWPGADVNRWMMPDIFIDLARHADVVIDNYRPGVTTRLGIGAADLRAVNERLIVCSISGFGGGL